MWRKELSERMKRGDESMRLNRAAFDRHTRAFERLMAAFDRHERRFDRSREIAEENKTLSRGTDWRNDPIAEGLAREADELLRAMRKRNQIAARRTDEVLAKMGKAREESRASLRELREWIDQQPSQAA